MYCYAQIKKLDEIVEGYNALNQSAYEIPKDSPSKSPMKRSKLLLLFD